MMKTNKQKEKKKAKAKFNLSINKKIFIAMISVVAITLLFVYFLGVVFLQQEYNRMKVDATLDALNEVENVLLSEKISDIDVENLREIAYKNELCIDISNQNGIVIYSADGIGSGCFTHQNTANRTRLYLTVKENKEVITINNVVDDENNTKFYIAGQYIDSINGDYIVLITTSLGSVVEATNIVASQLVTIGIVLFFVAFVLSVLVTSFITRPLKKLTVGLNNVASGNLDVTLPTDDTKGGEMNMLYGSFNIMVDKVKRSERVQRELVANVSHDLKTPLTTIKGYAELIKDFTGEDEVKRNEQLDIIINETDRLSSFVKDIMDLSLLQAGATVLNKENFDIIELIHQVVNRFSYYEETYGYKFYVNSIDRFLVNADKIRIEQVLHNLINNAVAHIGEDKTLYINAKYIEHEKRLLVEIIDHGEGIKKEDLEVIFERYYKPYRTAKGENRGTGLGLSIVKSNLNAHNMPFGVNSEVGVGSNFWFKV